MKSTVYLNGNIVTVNDKMPSAEAVLVTDGKIKFVGSKEEALNIAGENVEIKDLNGNTLLPGL